MSDLRLNLSSAVVPSHPTPSPEPESQGYVATGKAEG